MIGEEEQRTTAPGSTSLILCQSRITRMSVNLSRTYDCPGLIYWIRSHISSSLVDSAVKIRCYGNVQIVYVLVNHASILRKSYMRGRNALLFADNFILTSIKAFILTYDALLSFIFISVIKMNNCTNLNLSTLRCTEDYSYKYSLSLVALICFACLYLVSITFLIKQ